jgi:hypothetical protein
MNDIAVAHEEAPKPETIAIWATNATVDGANTETVTVSATFHRPMKPNGAAMITCPDSAAVPDTRQGRSSRAAEQQSDVLRSTLETRGVSAVR